jgi:predicted HAD superfamily hydrolase
MISSNFVNQGFLNVSEIEQIIANPEIKIVSFDVFDTLVYRPAVFPKDIFYIVDRELDAEGITDFISYRADAEEKLKKPNASFEDIYKFIEKEYNLPGKTIEAMKSKELEVELSLIKPRLVVKKLYDFALAQGKKVIVISDMYLTKDFIKEILDKNDYKSIESIFVSCEYNKRKDSGELYDEAIKILKAKPSEIVHIGDNHFSDIEVPAKKGIVSLYVPSFMHLAMNCNEFNKIFTYQKFSDDPFARLLMGFVLGDYFSNYGHVIEEKLFKDFDDFTLLGIIPTIFQTALYILNNKEIQSNYQQVFFASRDGYQIEKVYSRLSSFLGKTKSKYFYAGRKAYEILDSKFRTFNEYYKYIARKNKKLKLKEFLSTFVSDSNVSGTVCSQIAEDENPELSKNTACLKILNKFKQPLDSYFTKAKSNAQRYYRKEFDTAAAGGSNRVIVFDCGYSGSVSYYISKTLKIYVDKIYLWSTKDNSARDRELKTKTYTIIQSNVPTNSGLHLIFEELFSPLEGTTLGFDNELKPILEKCSFNKEMVHIFRKIDRIVAVQTEKLIKTFGTYLKHFQIYDYDKFTSILNYAITSSRFGERKLLKPIVFPDLNFFSSNNVSLMNKIDKALNDSSHEVLRFTGFNDFSFNYLPAPECNDLPEREIGIHVHCFNQHLMQEIIFLLKDFPYKFDLYVTTPNKESVGAIKIQTGIIKKLNKLSVIEVPNRGRDIAPWLVSTRAVQNNYDYFCHINTKESKHLPFGENWRKYLYANLLERKAVIDIFSLFESNHDIGCVYPFKYYELTKFEIQHVIRPMGMFGEQDAINRLLEEFGINQRISNSELNYSAGSMYWYRPKAFRQLFEYGFKFEDFPAEPIGVGGTITHAIERLPTFLCTYNNFVNMQYSRYRIYNFEDVVFGKDSSAKPNHYVLKEGVNQHTKNGEFFAKGYLEMYPDVAKTKMDPWHHYVLYGKKAGRDNGMHPLKTQFCAEKYLEMNPDVAKIRMDPWHHYVLYGKKEGRSNGVF